MILETELQYTSQLALLNIFLLPKGTQRIRKQDNTTGHKNLIHTEGEIIW